MCSDDNYASAVTGHRSRDVRGCCYHSDKHKQLIAPSLGSGSGLRTETLAVVVDGDGGGDCGVGGGGVASVAAYCSEWS